MNPATATQKPSTPTLRDVVPVKPNQASAAPAPPQPIAAASKPEIVDNIPVRIFAGSNDTPKNTLPKMNPIGIEPKQFAETEKDDHELERILKDVNKSVKESDSSIQTMAKNGKKAAKKTKQENDDAHKSDKRSPPIAATVAALAVSSILIVSALIIFSRS